MGSPTDSNWQKVGEMCLSSTKERVSKGEFKGINLTFMGLNNQNLQNFLFRGFLKPWERHTVLRSKWIDLVQADYNARLQQSIATKTVAFDIIEMGAPFEGDVCGKGLASEMPNWVKDQIDMDDYVGYLKDPVGTWEGNTYRISINGDCHNFNYRNDYFKDATPLLLPGNPRGTRALGVFQRPGRRCRKFPSFLKARRIQRSVEMPMATWTQPKAGADLGSISSAAVQQPMLSILMILHGCSIPKQ
jgi:multiple sugar transport system substrate-binding protein